MTKPQSLPFAYGSKLMESCKHSHLAMESANPVPPDAIDIHRNDAHLLSTPLSNRPTMSHYPGDTE